MGEVLPGWLSPSSEPPAAQAESHLRVLRDLLARDYLSHAELGYALQDLARMAQHALSADKTLVALLHPCGAWSAVTSDGTRLGDAEISAHGSRSVLLAPAGTQRLLAEHLQLQALAEGQGGPPAAAVPAAPASATRTRRPPRRSVDEAERTRLRDLLARKIAASRGTISALAADPEVAAAFGYERGLMPDSTLAVWIRDLDLRSELEEQRRLQAEALDLAAIQAAIHE
jgi:hypothetical protein